MSKSRRKWPWVVGGIVLLLFVIGLTDGGEKDSTSTAPPAASQAPAPAVPAQVMLPADPVGKDRQQPTPPTGPVTSAGQQAALTTPAERVETPSERTTAARPQPAARQPHNDSSSANAVYYQNCDAARAAGAAPLTSGEPGYRLGLDRDKDGTACE